MQAEPASCGATQAPLSFPLSDPTLGIGSNPARMYSWSLNMPDYYEDKLWQLDVFRRSALAATPRPRNFRSNLVGNLDAANHQQQLQRIFRNHHHSDLFLHSSVALKQEQVIERMDVMLNKLSRWLSCPFTEIQSLTWMFLVMLELALHSTLISAAESSSLCPKPAENGVHLNAAGTMLGIINVRVKTQAEWDLFVPLAELFRHCNMWLLRPARRSGVGRKAVLYIST